MFWWPRASWICSSGAWPLRASLAKARRRSCGAGPAKRTRKRAPARAFLRADRARYAGRPQRHACGIDRAHPVSAFQASSVGSAAYVAAVAGRTRDGCAGTNGPYPTCVELRHLRYFVTVSTELHFARAAERLFISQPALSQQIRSLEGELGFQLLQRNSRGVRLTPEGEAFLAEAKTVVRDADHAADVARALAKGATGHLRLSHLRTMPVGLPERVVSEYQRRYPGVEIIPESGSTEQNIERLRGGQLDLAFVLAPLENAPELGCMAVSTEPFVVAMPSAHPLSRRRRIRREDLAAYHWCTTP